MATNYIGLRRTRAALLALVAKLQALTWTPAAGAPAQRAFEKVELFTSVDLEKALQALLIAESRIALVVFGGSHFDSDVVGTDLKCQQTRTVFVLVSDRAMGDPVAAMLGTDDATFPGAVTLADLVVEGVSGVLVANPQGIYLQPVDVEDLKVTDAKQKNLPGRCGQVVTCELRGGFMTKDLGKQPFL